MAASVQQETVHSGNSRCVSWRGQTSKTPAFERSQQLVDRLLEVTSEGIFGIDSDGGCVFINDSAASMLGYVAEELIGSHILDLIRPPHDDTRFNRSDGSNFPVRVFPHPWVESGRVLGSIYVFEDLSETLRLARELREARRRYRELFDHVTSGVYQTSPEGELLAVNPALVELLGYNSELELRALDVSDLYVEPQERRRFTAQLERDGFLRNAVLTLRRKDGRTIRVVENARTVRSETGRVLYFEGTLNREK